MSSAGTPWKHAQPRGAEPAVPGAPQAARVCENPGSLCALFFAKLSGRLYRFQLWMVPGVSY